MIELYPTTKNKELAEMFHVAECTIYYFAHKLGLKKPREFFAKVSENEKCVASQFRKGHTPHNKGVKGYTTTNERKIANMKKTQFKKGKTHRQTAGVFFVFGALRTSTHQITHHFGKNPQFFHSELLLCRKIVLIAKISKG